MTLAEIKALVAAVDPLARHYASASRPGESYTVWRETRRLDTSADGGHAEEAWAFTVDRYTKSEADPVAAALFAALDGDDRVAVSHLVDYEPDTGYIHHIYDCEAI